MSHYIGESTDHDCLFEIGDFVAFDHEDQRLTGKVVRVYNSRLLYHVEVDGKRYEVAVPDDNPEKV